MIITDSLDTIILLLYIVPLIFNIFICFNDIKKAYEYDLKVHLLNKRAGIQTYEHFSRLKLNLIFKHIFIIITPIINLLYMIYNLVSRDFSISKLIFKLLNK